VGDSFQPSLRSGYRSHTTQLILGTLERPSVVVPYKAMSTFELLSLLIALLAAIISTIALIRTRTMAQQQLELQRSQLDLQREHGEVTKQLAQLHLEAAKLESAQRSVADLRVSLERGYNRDDIVIENVGGAAARDVLIEFLPKAGTESPLIPDDVAEKLPATLRPGDRCPLLAALAMGCLPPFDFIVRWRDPSGDAREEQVTVYG
jgi:hypothetical protein